MDDVTETLAPGAVVSAIAHRWQICPQQVFGWRPAARAGALARPAERAFVPIVGEAARPIVTKAAPPALAMTAPPVSPCAPAVEVTLAGAVARVASGTDGASLTAMLRAVRASAA